MGNIIQEALAEDGAEIIGEIGEVVTWNGVDYPALIGTPEVGLDLEEGGLMADGDFKIKILRAALPNPHMQDGDEITYDGDSYVTPNATVQRTGSAYITFDIAANL